MEEGHYVVEQLLDVRKEKGRFEFLVKWCGFESEHNTWEPTANLNPKARECLNQLHPSFHLGAMEKITKRFSLRLRQRLKQKN